MTSALYTKNSLRSLKNLTFTGAKVLSIDESGIALTSSQVVSDTDWYEPISEITGEKGYINLLAYKSQTGKYTSGEIFEMRLTVDGVEIESTTTTINGPNQGETVIGSFYYDGTTRWILPTGFAPFKTGFKIEFRVSTLIGTPEPLIYYSYVLLD